MAMAVISALIPARNEADRVGATVRAVRAALAALPAPDSEVIVVDDGSTDATAQLAGAAGARVVRRERNSGKGAALNAGLRECRGEIILTIDADLGESASEAGKLAAPVLAGQADMTVAVLPAAGKSGGFGTVVRLARWGIRRATGQEVAAPLSGQRAIRREVLDALGGFEEGFGVETGLTLDALRRGYRVVDVPAAIEHRALGRTARGFAHRAKQLLHVARVLWRKRAWRRNE